MARVVFKLGNLSSRNCCRTPSFFKHFILQLHCHCSVLCRRCGLQHMMFLLKRMKLFSAKPASAGLFPFWIGFAVVRASGDFLTGLCFISLKQVQRINLYYIASEKWFKTNDPTACIQTSCRLLLASRLLEIWRFWALLEYLTVAGLPAVVVTGMATQD